MAQMQCGEDQVLPHIKVHAHMVIKLERLRHTGKHTVPLYGKISAHVDGSNEEIVLFHRCPDDPAKVYEGKPIPLSIDTVDLYNWLNVQAHLKEVNPHGCPIEIADGDANFPAKYCGTSTANIDDITVTVHWSSII